MARPAQRFLRQFILKVHSRCDLACDHCYVYTMADQRWRERPVVMSRRTARQAADRIAEHAHAHGLAGVDVVLHGGEPVELTATEFRLLCYLAAQRGRIVSKAQILTSVWGYDAFDPNLVEVHVSALRRKLEAHGPRLLHTVRGLGYVLRAGNA